MSYPTSLDSYLSYIDLLLYRESTEKFYEEVRDEMGDDFPPPAKKNPIISAINRSDYCKSKCKCPDTRGQMTISYGACMKGHLRRGCMSELDQMTLCDYSIPQLAGLPPLYDNIVPSQSFEEGSRRKITPGLIQIDESEEGSSE